MNQDCLATTITIYNLTIDTLSAESHIRCSLDIDSVEGRGMRMTFIFKATFGVNTENLNQYSTVICAIVATYNPFCFISFSCSNQFRDQGQVGL
jgi:hypothetical protein